MTNPSADSIDVELPDGTVIEGVPKNVTQTELVAKLTANGFKVPEEWLPKKVGILESALRTAGSAAAPMARHVNLLVHSNIAGVMDKIHNLRTGRDDSFYREAVFAADKEQRESMDAVYAEKPGEKFATGGKVLGGVMSIPQSMLSTVAGASFTDTSAEILNRGGSMGEAVKAGATSAGVDAALMALPVATGLRTVKKLAEAGKGVSRATAIGVGAGTGAAVNVVGGAAGRGVKNAALPEGDQYKDMHQDPWDPQAVAMDVVGAVLLGGHAGAKARTAGLKAKAAKFPEAELKSLGDGEFEAPNGAVITRELWESGSEHSRKAWMKPAEKPVPAVEEKIPVGETAELTVDQAAAAAQPTGTAELDTVIAGAPDSAVAKVARAEKAAREKQAAANAETMRRKSEADELRQAAAETDDAAFRARLLATATKLEAPPKKIPVGEVKEGQPDIQVEPRAPITERGVKVTEGAPEAPAPEVPKAGEIPVGEVVPEGGVRLTADEANVETRQIPVGETKELYVPPEKTKGDVATAAREEIPVGEATELPATSMTDAAAKADIDAAIASDPKGIVGKVAKEERAARVAAERTAGKVAQDKADAAALRRAAVTYSDEGLRSRLLARADKLDPPPKKIPVGEVKEGQPDIQVEPRAPITERGVKVTEGAPEVPAPEVPKAGEIPVGEVVPEGGVRLTADEANVETRQIPVGETKELYVPPEKTKGAPADEHADLNLPKIDESMLEHQQRASARREPVPDERGRRHIREALDKGVAEGKLDSDAVSLLKWVLDKNPNLARGQRMEVHDTEGRGLGSYNSATRIIKIFKGNNEHTAVHEFMHAVERMLPESVQRGIRREWRKALDDAIKNAKSPIERDALNHAKRAVEAGTVESQQRVIDAFKSGALDKTAHYKLVDPSEFWGVNAPRILADKAAASRGSWVAKARQFMKEIVEHSKAVVGVRSDSAVLKALSHVLDPGKVNGLRGSGREMLTHAERKPQVAHPAGALDVAAPTKPELKTLPDESKADIAERKLFDRFNRVLKMQDVVNPKSEAADVYAADVAYHGRVQHRGDELVKTWIKPLGKALEAAKKVGITVRDFDDYLIALHAPERNAAIAARNPKMPDGGSGMTNAQAAETLALFTPEQIAKMAPAAKLVHDMNRAKLDVMASDGLITAETRDKLNAQFKHYVPLKTLDDEGAFTGTGRGYALRATDITTAMGRESKAGSPTAASVMDASRAIIRGEKARVDRAIWEFAQDPEATAILRPYDAGAPPKEVMDRKIGPDGKVKDIVSSKLVQDTTIPLLVDGNEVRVFVPDVRLREQLMKVGSTADPGKVLATIGRGTSTVGRLLTEYNPAFTVPNAVKDALTVAVRSGAHEGVSVSRTLANIPVSWKDIAAYKAGLDTEGAKQYKEFLEAGGKTGAYGIQGVADTMRNLEKLGAKLGYDTHTAGYARRAGRVLAEIPKLVSSMNEVLEYASRFAFYKEMRRAGNSPARSAVAAKEITVNFNRSGEWGRGLNSVLVFTNAALQGLRNTGVYLGSKKLNTARVRYNVLGLAAMGAAVQMWNEMLGGENEETGEPNINSQHDAIADKNVLMLLPGSAKGLKIPLPPEYALPYTIGRRLVRAATQGEIKREAAGIVGAALDATLPVRLPEADSHAQAVGRAVVPTLAAPVADLWFNQSYFGQPIVPEQHDKKAPAPYFTNSRANTSDLAKSMSETVNAWTGGDRVTPGWGQKALGPLISPEGIEHLVRGYTGGVGQIVMQSRNVAKNAAEGKPQDINKLPIVNRFAFAEPQSYVSRRFNELSTEYEYAARYDKTGESEKISPRIASTLDQYLTTKKVLGGLFKELRDAGASGADREPIHSQIKAAQAELIKAYNKTRDEQ